MNQPIKVTLNKPLLAAHHQVQNLQRLVKLNESYKLLISQICRWNLGYFIAHLFIIIIAFRFFPSRSLRFVEVLVSLMPEYFWLYEIIAFMESKYEIYKKQHCQLSLFKTKLQISRPHLIILKMSCFLVIITARNYVTIVTPSLLVLDFIVTCLFLRGILRVGNLRQMIQDLLGSMKQNNEFMIQKIQIINSDDPFGEVGDLIRSQELANRQTNSNKMIHSQNRLKLRNHSKLSLINHEDAKLYSF